ncbi:MAG: hypothetical protein HRU09_00445 [Oligoflexales bacterium]|nr:hypothetical protein [Oligoflexales bacterium]
MSSRKGHKKIFLVNRDFQMRYTKSAVVIGLVSTFLTSVVILYPLYQFQILRIPKFLPIPILFAMILAAVINIAIIGVMGILMTHRIAGPMYSLVRSMRVVSLGRFNGTMRLRNDDDLKFVVRNFNDMTAALRSLTEDDLQTIKNELGMLDRLKQDEQVEELKKNLQDFCEKLEKRLQEG